MCIRENENVFPSLFFDFREPFHEGDFLHVACLGQTTPLDRRGRDDFIGRTTLIVLYFS